MKPYSLKAFRAKYLIIRGSYFSVETLQDQNGPSSVVRNCMFACIKNIHQLVHGHMWIYESLHISCDNEIKLAWHLDIRGLLKPEVNEEKQYTSNDFFLYSVIDDHL